MHRRGVIVFLAVLLAAVYGAGTQYLGSLSMHPWLADVSLLSAPWLALAFLAGATQRDPRWAAALALLCTFTAWIGYGAMTLSPMEGAEMSWPAVVAFARSQADVIAGGFVTGPVFGWLGHRWRLDRAWWAALVTAGAFCLEPLARTLYWTPIASSTVVVAEVALGVALMAYGVIGARLNPDRPS